MPTSTTSELAAIAGDGVVVAGLEGEAASLETASASDGGGTSNDGSGAEPTKPPRPSSRFITIAVVSATLAAAVVGFLFNHASSAGQHASDQAQEISLQASRLQTSNYQSAEDDYYNYLLQQSDDAKATQSYFESTLNDPDPQQWADLQNVTDHLATQEGKTLPKDMHPDEANGPNPNFPGSFFAARTESATRLSSLANAYNDISTKWGKLGGSYSAILTVLAISLLLLGSSLALYGSSRMMFVRLGVVLLVIAVLWAATATISEPGPQAAAGAAQAYARGVTDGANLTTPNSARPAMKAFTEAIQARPDYAQAYDLRAESEDAIGTLGPYSDYDDVVATPWLTKAVQDERTAYGLGLRSEDELTDFGTDSFDLWVSQGEDSAFPSDAFAADEELTSVDSNNPVGWTEMGLVDLLRSQFQQAKSAFAVSVEDILYSDIAAKTPRPSHAFVDQEDWVGNAVSQFDQLANSPAARQDASLRSETLQFEGYMTGSVAAGRAIAPTRPAVPITMKSSTLYLLPSSLGINIIPASNWNPQVGGRDLTSGNVLALWYSRPIVHGKGSGAWSAISSTIDWGNSKKTSPLGDPQFCGGDEYCENSDVLTNINQCLANAQYRFDVFYDGVRVFTRVVRPTTVFGDPAARRDPQMNVGACLPASWKLSTSLTGTSTVAGTSSRITNTLSGFLMSYESAGNKYGYDVLRIYPARDGFTGDLTTFSADVAQYAVTLLAGTRLPSDMESDNPLTNEGFMNLKDNVMVPYQSANSDVSAYVGAGITNDDAVVVAVEYGPAKWIDSLNAVELFYSSSLLDYG